MKCEDVLEGLRSGGEADSTRRQEARAHLALCDRCDAAAEALLVLEAERHSPVPRLAAGAFARALEHATRPRSAAAAGRRGFWFGAAVGGALAASIAVAMTLLWLQPSPPSATANPEIRLGLHEVRAVRVSLDSPEALSNAQIHVVLTGAVGLEGFADQRELRWTTDLDKGVNQLMLPLVALGPSGGQVMVEVQHGDKRRTFVVDVRTIESATAAG